MQERIPFDGDVVESRDWRSNLSLQPGLRAAFLDRDERVEQEKDDVCERAEDECSISHFADYNSHNNSVRSETHRGVR